MTDQTPGPLPRGRLPPARVLLGISLPSPPLRPLASPEEGDERLGIGPPGLQPHDIGSAEAEVLVEHTFKIGGLAVELVTGSSVAGIYDLPCAAFALMECDEAQIRQLALARVIQ